MVTTLKKLVTRGLNELCALTPGAPPKGLRILMYHAVGTSLAFDDIGLSIDPERFRRHMKALKDDARFNPVPLDFRALTAPGRPIAVTFDDGFRDNLTAAAPILSELGLPFTVFVVPGYVNGKSPNYLTLWQLRELSALPGCTIGSHGMNHRPLAELPPKELDSELSDSRKWLEDNLGRPVTTLSYPYGSASVRVRDAAVRAGYTLAACSRTGINTPGRDAMMLCRTEILAWDGPRQFRQKLAGAWDWHRFRHPDPAKAN